MTPPTASPRLVSAEAPPFPDDQPPTEDSELPEAATAMFRSWQTIDPTTVLAGDWAPPQATVGRRSDSVGLFYAGKVHTISSETEAGKTWLAIAGCVDEILAGNNVLYIDFEDDIGSVVARLLALQLNADTIKKHFHYIRPLEPLGTGIHADDLRQVLADTKPTLAVIDGVTEAMTVHGLNPLDNADVAKFGRMLPRRIAAAGPAVVLLDHVTKDREGRGRYAIGAVHKINALDGAAYVLENRKPFGIGLTGHSTIKIAKDRPGQLRRHALPSSGGMHWFGDLVLESHNSDFAEIRIDIPEQRDDDFEPTWLMEKLWKVIDKHGGDKGLSGRAVQDLARGNATNNRQAVALLVSGGFISPTPHKATNPYPPEGLPE